jgi:RNA polymerase sigma-70 factor (ECF subfamily)
MPLTDDEILQRVQGGERAAYMELFERHYNRIEGYARRQLQDAEAARDIASETFLRAYRTVDQFRREQGISYQGYLLLICRRLVLNERERRRGLAITSLEECAVLAERLMDPAEPPLMQLLHTERRSMLHEALEDLSPEDREIIHLAFECGLSRRDIGAVLGKPSVSAVTSHLHRAMQKLKNAVIRHGYFSGEYEAGRK